MHVLNPLGSDCFLIREDNIVNVSCFRWYFTILSISGIFAVTFSVIFAYVADITTVEDRSAAYGLVCHIYSILDYTTHIIKQVTPHKMPLSSSGHWSNFSRSIIGQASNSIIDSESIFIC